MTILRGSHREEKGRRWLCYLWESRKEEKLQDTPIATEASLACRGRGTYAADIRARRKEAQKSIAYRLHRLGWTQEEIAEQVGIRRDHFNRDFLSQFPELENGAKNLLASGFPHLEVAERFNLPLILVHAIDLHGREDQDRLKRLGITLQPYDVWNFARCDDLYGGGWPGRIPGPSERFRCASPVRVVE